MEKFLSTLLIRGPIGLVESQLDFDNSQYIGGGDVQSSEVLLTPWLAVFC